MKNVASYPARLILVAGFIAVCLGACGYRQDKGTSALNRSTGAAPSYAQVRDQVLTPKCLHCHQEFQDYAKTFAARDYIHQKVFVERTMPKADTLSTEQSDLLTKWLEAGAPEQGQGPATAPSTPAAESREPTWVNVQKNFFSCYCTRCHSGDDPAKSLDLTDLNQIRAKASVILNRVLVVQNMPKSKKDYDAIGLEDKLLLANWIAARMPGPDGSLYTPPAPPPRVPPTTPPVAPAPAPATSPLPTP